jgi:hypothetical protein
MILNEEGCWRITSRMRSLLTFSPTMADRERKKPLETWTQLDPRMPVNNRNHCGNKATPLVPNQHLALHRSAALSATSRKTSASFSALPSDEDGAASEIDVNQDRSACVGPMEGFSSRQRKKLPTADNGLLGSVS